MARAPIPPQKTWAVAPAKRPLQTPTSALTQKCFLNSTENEQTSLQNKCLFPGQHHPLAQLALPSKRLLPAVPMCYQQQAPPSLHKGLRHLGDAELPSPREGNRHYMLYGISKSHKHLQNTNSSPRQAPDKG